MMKQTSPHSAINYFAAMTFGQRLGMTKNLFFKHGPVLVGLELLFSLAVVGLFIGLMFILKLNIGRFDRSESLLIFFFLAIVPLIIASGFWQLGIEVLALRFAARKPTAIISALLAPIASRPFGILLSLLVWFIISLVIFILIFLPIRLLPKGLYQLILLSCLILPPSCLVGIAGLYIADCVNRGRRFKIHETISRPSALFFGSFASWMLVLLVTVVIFIIPDIALRLVLRAFADSIGLMIFIYCFWFLYDLLATAFIMLLLIVTYKQAKAGIILNQRRLMRRA